MLSTLLGMIAFKTDACLSFQRAEEANTDKSKLDANSLSENTDTNIDT